MHIIIDIGHANGTGARGNGREEHALCAAIAKRLQAALQQAGHAVSLLDFPERSNTDDLRLTIAAANAISGARLGISLHCDASDNRRAHGAHVCYCSESGKTAARCIAASLCRLLPGRAESVVRRANLAILKETSAPWALCECGFVTHAGDSALQQNSPESIARAIAQGISDYATGIELARP